MPEILPNFIIIGAMKCGTSTLHEQLARQPGIFMSEPKEPNYFSNDEVYSLGQAWYSRLFSGAGSAVLRGESSTHYTKLPTYPKTLERMRSLLPRLKIIYLMRHPVDRSVSHYMHEWSMRSIDAPIDRAICANRELVEYSCYYMQLQPFLQTYGRASILPVFLEHMQREPQAELERVCRFLDYSGVPRWAKDLAPQNVTAERLRLGPIGRRLVNNPLLKLLRRTLVPQAMRSALKVHLSMGPRPQLSPRSRARVVARFDEDLRKLGRELGVDLSCATFSERVAAAPLEWASES
jgi:hypothetical protein